MDTQRKKEKKKELESMTKDFHSKVVASMVVIETRTSAFESRCENAKKQLDLSLDLKVKQGLEVLYKDVKWLSKLQGLSQYELKEKYKGIFKDITTENTEYFRTRTNNFIDSIKLREKEVEELIQRFKESTITKTSVQKQPKEKRNL